jgi:type IV secretion system protein VirB11
MFINNNNNIYFKNLEDDLSFIKVFLDNKEISDIMVNADGSIFIKIKGKRQYATKIDDTTIVKRAILSIASIQGIEINSELPILESVIPFTKYRIEGVLPPISDGPVLVVRKPTVTSLTLSDYINASRITKEQKDKIMNALINKYNILITGGTGSGKTTLVNTLLKELSIIDPDCRLFIIEDTPELNISNKDFVSFVVPPKDTITMLRVALRSNPDRIIFGELRHGDVAIELLKAFNSGHPGGITTIHANTSSLDDTLYRLYSLISEVIHTITINDIKNFIDCVITIDVKKGFGPYISNVYFISDYS